MPGAGCPSELADAVVVGLQLAVLDDDFRLCERARLDLLSATERSRYRAAWVVPGERTDAQVLVPDTRKVPVRADDAGRLS